MRFRSYKTVKSLEECCHPYIARFESGNRPDGLFLSINGIKQVLPLNEDIMLTESEWKCLKSVNKDRGFLPENNYDIFK